MPKYHETTSAGKPRVKPWQASVRINNTTMFLGYFDTKEEAVRVEDDFRAGKDDPGTVLVQCYCQRTWVWIPKSWVKKFTKSCGAKSCVHPLMKKVAS
jgi:hypothetical protein